MYRRDDWTVFRSLETIPQRAGVPREKLASLVAKELADNALDASGGCRVALSADGGFTVADDGEGIPGDDAQIADLFSIARPLTSTKVLRLPTRGALGNGLRVVAGTVLASRGALEVSTRGRTLWLTPRDDGTTEVQRVADWSGVGTTIGVELGPPLIVNDATLRWAREAINLSGGERYEGRTSPHWYDSDSFYELLQAAVGRTVREAVAEMDGCAEPKAGRIAADHRGRPASALSRDEATKLLSLAKAGAKIVKAVRLGGIGRRADLALSYAKAGWTMSTRPAPDGSMALMPVVIEAWAEIADKAEVRITINRTPTPGEFQAWHEKGDMHWYGCGVRMKVPTGRKPARLRLNIDVPFMPITSDGKSPDLSLVADAIEKTAATAVKRAKRLLPLVRDDDAPRSQKGIILEALPDAVAKASGSGEYRFSLRQLFYAVRPVMLAEIGKAPEYNYFGGIITDHEALAGDIPGMYRDPRGTLYHPHTREEIPLGTLNIEAYCRPAWTFNKILYCEKEGFFPLLKEVGWAERNDCALMSAKGFASRAARDVLDLLGDGEEEMFFYCIHDADAEGTSIYQALQEATRARPGRKVRIVNLGLEPREAVAMGLQVEPVERKGDRAAPVAAYVGDAEREWLQANRVELNAMTTPVFLEWLNGKFAAEVGKVVPPDAILDDLLRRRVRESLRRKLRRAILRRVKLSRRTEAAFQRRRPEMDRAASAMADRVRGELAESPAEPWTAPVARAAEEIACGAGARTPREADAWHG